MKLSPQPPELSDSDIYKIIELINDRESHFSSLDEAHFSSLDEARAYYSDLFTTATLTFCAYVGELHITDLIGIVHQLSGMMYTRAVPRAELIDIANSYFLHHIRKLSYYDLCRMYVRRHFIYDHFRFVELQHIAPAPAPVPEPPGPAPVLVTEPAISVTTPTPRTTRATTRASLIPKSTKTYRRH
jgi:hypothetical protein